MSRIPIPIRSTVVLLLLILLTVFSAKHHPEYWRTPDQQADRLARAQKFDEAAKLYTDPFRQGTALFRAGEFEAAASAFSRTSTPEANYNKGNALVMLGKYEDAIKAYDKSLRLRPGWTEALDNREIAVLRRDRLKTTGGDDTEGQLKPDEVIFEKGRKNQGTKVQVDGGAPLNDDALRALWLRRVQTKPADFLKAKFAFQSRQASGESP